MKKEELFFLVLFVWFLFLVKEVNAITNTSEIRAWYIGDRIGNWDALAELAKDYKINMIVPGCLWLYGAMYPSKYAYQFYGTPPSRDELALALQAFHSRGIEVHCMMLVFFIWEGFPKDLPIPESWKAVNCENKTINWADPCHPKVRELIKNLTQELASNYDIDGFMFDYIRYDQTGYSEQESYSQYCKEWFENDTGIKVTNWPTDVCPGGQYHRQWMEWRVTPITKMVEDIRNWMLEIKPNLEFSAAVFTIFSRDAYAYWRWDIGQDTANWVGKNYLDMVNPMCYTPNVEDYKQYVTNSTRYFVGTKEGKIPIVIWTSSGALHTETTSEVLKSIIEACREVGCDGWIIWRYGGPENLNPETPDIRPTFQLLDLPDTFSLGSIKAFPSANEATIAWITDKPTTSKVEYSLSPLFVPNFTSGSWGSGFPYWDIVYNPGIILEDNTNVTVHKITLTNLQEGTTYYFRVQSKDDSGIVTSKVYNFTTGTGSYPITISGKVTDSENNLPVKAIVYCNNYGSVSDNNGNYAIKLKSGGSCDLTAESFGYITKKIPISFSGSITQNIILEPIKVSLKGRIVNKTGYPVQAEIKVYKDNNLISSTQTDSQGNYSFNLRIGTYDFEVKPLNFFASIRIPSVRIMRNEEGKIKEITFLDSNRISILADIETKQIIEIDPIKVKKVFYNGTEIGSDTSISSLKPNKWYYDFSKGKLYLKLDPYPKTECIHECCKNETNYYDKPCPSDKYCSNNVCKPKTSCPFECCINEEKYLDKLCPPPSYCVNRKCVEYSGYWKFDEGSGNIAYDSSGLGNNGTIYGATWSSDCISGKCLDFDGIDDYVKVPNSPTLTIDGEITLEAWVYLRGWNRAYPGIASKYYPRGYLLGIQNSTGKWTFWLRTKEGGLGIIWSDDLAEFNKWVHLAVVRDSNNIVKMYVNGTLQSTTITLKGSIAEPDRDFLIGQWDGYINGKIDEVIVYNRALSEAEIKAHANGNYQPLPKCSDGTGYGYCSLTKPYYCDNGSLIVKCSLCGCPSEQICAISEGKEVCISPAGKAKTFGNTNIGNSSTNVISKNFIYGSKFSLSEKALVTNISVYAYFGADYNRNYKAMIYSDSNGLPGALKGVSEEKHCNEAWKWYTFNFDPALVLNPGNYWLMVWSDVNWYILKYDPGGNHAYKSVTYGIPPNPFGSPDGTGNQSISIYATYLPI